MQEYACSSSTPVRSHWKTNTHNDFKQVPIALKAQVRVRQVTAVIGRNINADISRFFLKVFGGLVPFDKVLLKINANLFRVPFLCDKTFLSWWEQCLLGWQCLSLHKLAELFCEYDSDIIIHHLLASPITKCPHSEAPQEDAELSFWPNPNRDILWKNGSSLYKLF